MFLMHPELSRLFDQHVAASFEKQLDLAEAVASKDWHLDLNEGLLSFGDTQRIPVQLLGTESERRNSWLWGWANHSEHLPQHLLGSVRLLKLLGEQLQIPELSEAELPIAEVGGHFLSLLACGVCRGTAYFRAPYEGGAAFLLLHQVPRSDPTGTTVARIVSVFPQVLADFPVSNHRLAFTAYLQYHDLEARSDGDTVAVYQGNTAVLAGAFDALQRLTKLEATVSS
jgi:hypothetical protein